VRRASRQLCSDWFRGEAGFTLLELTIAMAFVGLLAGGIVISISTCLNVWQHTQEAAEMNQEARAILELLSRDLRGAYRGVTRISGSLYGTPAADEGPGDTLELSTESSAANRAALMPPEVQQEWGEQQRPPVTDYVQARWELREASDEGPAGLYRTTMVVPVVESEMEDRAQVTEMPRELISAHVTALRFDYFDGQDWWRGWDSFSVDNRLPQAVAVRFRLENARGRTQDYGTIVAIATR